MAGLARYRGEYNSETIFPLEDRSSGVYEREMLIKGNSILSTLFVSQIDAGATLEIEYYETTTQAAKDAGQYLLLEKHAVVTTAPFTQKLTITRIHSSPSCRVTLTGGNAIFEVHNTVVTSFASDLDSALVAENQPADLSRDQGIPISGYDNNGTYHFVRVVDGVLQVGGELTAGEIIINKRLYNETMALIPDILTTHISYTIPTGKVFRWLNGSASATTWMHWRVEIDGQTWLSKRNDIDMPNVDLTTGRVVNIQAGSTIEVIVKNLNPYGYAGTVETVIFGREENVV